MAVRMVNQSAVCAAAVKDRREEAARRKREMEAWREQQKELERVETLEKKRWEFLQSRLERLEQARRLELFVADYEKSFERDALPDSCQALLDWISRITMGIRTEISPDRIAATLDKYQLMDDRTSIDSWTRIED